MKDATSLIILGKGTSAAIAKYIFIYIYIYFNINFREGALKIKEITYIHAEAFSAGEMKHGPIALIDSTKEKESKVILMIL